jgi:hypothetical protein
MIDKEHFEWDPYITIAADIGKGKSRILQLPSMRKDDWAVLVPDFIGLSK